MGKKKKKRRQHEQLTHGNKITANTHTISAHKKQNAGMIFIVIAVSLFSFFILGNPGKMFAQESGMLSMVFVLFMAAIPVYVIVALQDESRNRVKEIFKWILFGLVVVNILLQFNANLDLSGDNMEYILKAKSLAQGMGPRLYHMIGRPLQPRMYNVGISLIMAPIIACTGDINLILIKIPFVLMTIGSLFLFYILLRKWFDETLAVLLTVALGMQRQILHFSSIAMTENAYIFFMMLSVWLIQSYDEKEKWFDWRGILIGFVMFFSFLVRNAGILAAGMPIIYFLVKKNIKKAVVIFIILMVCAGGFLFTLHSLQKQKNNEDAAAAIEVYTGETTGSYLQRILSLDLSSRLNSIGDLVAALSMKTGSEPDRFEKFTIILIALLGLMLIGFIFDCIRDQTGVAYIVLLYILGLIIGIGEGNIGYQRYSRYVVPLIPFIFILLLFGVQRVLEFLSGVMTISEKNRHVIPVLFIVLLFGGLMHGAALEYHTKEQLRRYPPHFINSWIDCGQWIKEHTDADIHCVARKERLFSYYADRQTDHYVYYQMDAWKDKAPENMYFTTQQYLTLRDYMHKKVAYLAVDNWTGLYINGDAFQRIIRMVSAFPECFALEYVPRQYVLSGPNRGKEIDASMFKNGLSDYLNYIFSQTGPDGRLVQDIYVPAAILSIHDAAIPAVLARLEPDIYRSKDCFEE